MNSLRSRSFSSFSCKISTNNIKVSRFLFLESLVDAFMCSFEKRFHRTPLDQHWLWTKKTNVGVFLTCCSSLPLVSLVAWNRVDQHLLPIDVIRFSELHLKKAMVDRASQHRLYSSVYPSVDLPRQDSGHQTMCNTQSDNESYLLPDLCQCSVL